MECLLTGGQISLNLWCFLKVALDMLSAQVCQIVDGKFADHRWADGRWQLEKFSDGKGNTDWDQVLLFPLAQPSRFVGALVN